VNWRTFVKTLAASTLVGAGAVYAWILLVDPYDDVWFSPPFEREPVSKNQRFSYPALARSARFDSVIVGTSSVRLLRPGQLNPLLHARFVNLAMNSAMPYEQAQILGLFTRHHPRIRYAFFGIDDGAWCTLEPTPKLTYRPFPPWMYDENRWNDLLYLFNTATVEQAWRQFRNILGIREPRYGRDGYTVFVPDESRYDLQKVRHLIYQDHQPQVKPAADPPAPVSAAERASWVFPNAELQRRMLEELPADTVKVLIFPPYHQFRQPAPGSRQAAVLHECKRRVAGLARTVANTTVIDFMIRSPITMDDRSYWDSQHYRVGIAAMLGETIVHVLKTGREDGRIGRVLVPPTPLARRAAHPAGTGKALAERGR
jgi:hypothetical protein